jgi:ABC-2 type transport system permease protein
MTGRPGTFVWFLGHELRLSWRQFRGLFHNFSTSKTIAIILGVLVVFHALAWPLAHWFHAIETDGARHFYIPSLIAGYLFVLPWIIAQALTSSTRALYSRGDLDLLLASPLPARTIVTARALAISAESVGSVAIFLLPLVNMNILVGGRHWLSIYPTLIGCGLFGTAIGLCVTLVLFRLAGPRRTRFIAQVVSTLIGASFAIGVQLANILPGAWRDGLIEQIDRAEPGSWFDRSSLIFLPVRAAAGDWPAVGLWLCLSIAGFGLSASVLGGFFAQSALGSAGLGAAAPAKPRWVPGHGRFRTGAARSLRRKEWRLLARDPWLISQVLLQILYVLPISIVLWRGQGPQASIGLAVAPFLVVVAAQLSASLAWLSLSGEDAPEFLRAAPLTRHQLERAKLEAIAVPVAGILAIPLAWLTLLAPLAGLWSLVFGAAAAACTALINLWHPMPGRRSDLMRRHSQSKFIGLLEHLMSLLWAVATGLALSASAWALLPIGLSMLLLWFNRQKIAAAASA